MNKKDWIPERSSGYDGYRNTVTGEWIYADEYITRCTHNDVKLFAEEFAKCLKSPYYFATKYLTVEDSSGNIKPFTTMLSEEQFNNDYMQYNNLLRDRYNSGQK